MADSAKFILNDKVPQYNHGKTSKATITVFMIRSQESGNVIVLTWEERLRDRS